MRLTLVLSSLLLALSVGASAQKLILSPDLDSAVEMKAKGRQGWQINQVIRFGEYSTSKTRRGWTKSYAIGFTLRFRNASQKLSFTQKTPDGLEAEVLAVSRFSSMELDMGRGFFSFPIDNRDAFAGTVIPGADTGRSWDFVLYNPDGSLAKDLDCGSAHCETGAVIRIAGVQKIEGMPRWMQAAYFGYEFYRDGRAIAAVSTVNNGRVWMNPDLDASTRLVIAALSSALLLRHDLSQTESCLQGF